MALFNVKQRNIEISFLIDVLWTVSILPLSIQYHNLLCSLEMPGIYLEFRKSWTSCNFDNVIPSKKMFCYYHYVVVVLVATQYLRRKRLCIFSLTKLLATLIFTISTSSFSQKKNTHNILRQSACFKSNDLQTNTHIHTHTQRLQGSDVSYGEVDSVG